MKTLRKTCIAIALILGITASVFAIEKEKLNTAVVENVVDAYIKTTVKGDMSHVNELFSQSFVQQTTTDYNQLTLSRTSYIRQLKNAKGVEYQCNSRYEVLEQQGKYTLAKVELVFANFTRTDYLTLVEKEKGWEIAQVSTVYDN